MNLTRALGSVGGLTLASRVLGLVRDSLFALFIGANFASDAFYVAFRLPNMFRALFAEGAFSAAFIPMFNRKVADPDGPGLPAGVAFAEDALSVLLPVLIVMTVLMEIFAWPVTYAISGGFHDPSPDQFNLAVELSRFTFPYLMLISLVSLLGGILNSLHKFWVAAAAPILLNLTLIAALLFFHTHEPLLTARNQAIAVTVAGALQLIWLIQACWASGVRLKIKLPRFNADVRRLMKLIGPAAAGAGAVQINLVVSTALAARYLPHGSVSYIYYADRLNQLPLGLIGIGLGTVLLPTISHQLGRGAEAEAMDTQNRGLELALFFTLPATVALVVCGTPIVAALFQHGAFTPTASFYTAQALAAFSIGLPSYILVKVLTPGYYARSDTRTPMRFAMISIAVNLVLNLAFILPLKHMGPPLATALASTVNVAMLYHTLRKRGHFQPDARLRRRAWRLLGSALIMGVALYFLNDLFTPYTTGRSLVRGLAMVVLVGGGGMVYAAACFATGAFRLADLRAALKRGEPKEDLMRVVSGIQPTGNLHLGNYLGAIKQWVAMQDDVAAAGGECLFFLADLHALTQPVVPAELAANTIEMAAALLACGIDPAKSILFNQARVPAHSELAWLLGGTARMGWLNRMTQWKDKAGKDRDGQSVGLFTYPVLMAADVLVYKASHVPVGHDQKQHLELARDVATKFNQDFGIELFPLPEPLVSIAAPRIMSLRDGSAKMSKSDPSEMSRIHLTDSDDAIAQKCRKARTDAEPLPDNFAALAERPEAKNLVTIYAALADKTPDVVVAEFAGQGFGTFKPALAEVMVAVIGPIRDRFTRLLDDRDALGRILAEGAAHANERAAPTLREAQLAVGLQV